MAMPASGCIGLRCCITGIACSSIGCAVCGSLQTPASLSSLSVAAGKSAPHAMSEFYGYAPATDTCFCFSTASMFTQTASVQDGYVIVCRYNHEAGDVVTVCFCANQFLSKLQFSCYWTKCNTGTWEGKGTAPTTYTDTLIDSNDVLCARLCIWDSNPTALIGEATFCLNPTPAGWTTGSGTAVRCSPYGCTFALGLL